MRTQMRSFLILAFCVLLLGCDHEYSRQLLEASKPPAEVVFSQKYTLKAADTLSVPLPEGIPSYSAFSDCMESDSLYYFSYDKHKMARVHLLAGKIDSVLLPKQLVSGNITAMTVINSDSVLFVQDQPARLLLLKEGAEIELFDLPKINFNTSHEVFNRISKSLPSTQTNFSVDNTNMLYDAQNQLVHIGLQPLRAYDKAGFENSARIGAYSLKSKKWVHWYAPPEGMMKYRGDKTYFYALSQKHMAKKGDTVFVGYSNDHYVYYYRNGSYLGKFPHTSSASKQLFLPVDVSYSSNVEKMKEYMIAAPKYGAFNYHKTAKLYSRLYFDKQAPFDDQGKYNPHNLFRNVYAVFLDEDFNPVGEYLFPKGGVEYVGAKATSTGFVLFSTLHNNIDTLNTVFKLQYVYNITPVTN